VVGDDSVCHVDALGVLLLAHHAGVGAKAGCHGADRGEDGGEDIDVVVGHLAQQHLEFEKEKLLDSALCWCGVSCMI